MDFRKILLVLCVFCAFSSSYSQNLYIDLYGGAMNYGGDLQAKSFTLQRANLAAGLGLTYELTPHIAVSGAFIHGKFDAADKITYPAVASRNLSFSTDLNEGSVRFEAQLFAPDKIKITPYAFAGVAVYSFNPYAYDSLGKKIFLQPLSTEGQGLPEYPDRKPYSLTQFAIPFGFGLKYSFSNDVKIGAELNFRKLFTDYLDDVSTTYPDTALLSQAFGPYSPYFSFRGDELKPPAAFHLNAQRGSPKYNDNFYSVTFKLSFSLGTKKERGMSSGVSKKLLRQSNCPRNL